MRQRTLEVQLWILIWKLGFVRRRRRRRRPIFGGGEIMSVAVFCHSPLCASASPSRLPVVIGPVVSVCLLPCIVVLCCALWCFVVHCCCALWCIVVLFCAALLWGETHCARWWALQDCSVVFEGDDRRWEFVVMRVAGTRELFGSWGDTLASPAMMLSSEGGLAPQPGQ